MDWKTKLLAIVGAVTFTAGCASIPQNKLNYEPLQDRYGHELHVPVPKVKGITEITMEHSLRKEEATLYDRNNDRKADVIYLKITKKETPPDEGFLHYFPASNELVVYDDSNFDGLLDTIHHRDEKGVWRKTFDKNVELEEVLKRLRDPWN